MKYAILAVSMCVPVSINLPSGSWWFRAFLSFTVILLVAFLVQLVSALTSTYGKVNSKKICLDEPQKTRLIN